MYAKVIWLAWKSKHWKQNLAANHGAVVLLKPVTQMTLTVYGLCTRLGTILLSARFDDKTQAFFFIIGMEVLQSTVSVWKFDFFLPVNCCSIWAIGNGFVGQVMAVPSWAILSCHIALSWSMRRKFRAAPFSNVFPGRIYTFERPVGATVTVSREDLGWRLETH